MLKEHKKFLNILFRLIDVCIILFTSLLAYYLEYSPLGLNRFDLFLEYKIFFLLYATLWLYLSHHFRLYASKRLTLFIHEAWDVTRTLTISLVILSLPILFIKNFPLSPGFFVKLWLFQLLTLILFRLAIRKVLRHIRSRGFNYRQILIVGRNTRAAKLAQEVEEMPDHGVRIVGFIDAPNGDTHQECSYNFKLLGTLDDLDRIVREQVVDEVFVTLPIKSFYSRIENIIQVCETVGVEVKIPTDLFNPRLSKSTISQYFDIPFIDLYTSPKMNWQLLIKRLIDVLVSSIMLILFSPILIVVSILIKTTSEGPLLFTQQRVGYNNRLFDLLKFRSMVNNAEELKTELLPLNEMDGPVFKIKNDPRVTTVGRFIRKTSIDELPQLINVLKGDMSLVGPRPPLPSEVSQYDLKDRRRLSMKPGITGIWQVCGRNTIPFDRWMEMDRQYIDQWSLWLDVKLLLKTVPAVLKGSGSA